jgi:23S rRNA (cytosine1962-C5)-methyltransferase
VVVSLPVSAVRLAKGKEDAVRAGMPWVYASDLIESSEHLMIPPGSVVQLENHKGQYVATGYFNVKSQIACRILSLGKEAIDTGFFARRLQAAVAKRDQLVGVPYYRMVHSEADGLPGLLIDRFGDICVVQAGTAGMELLQPLWLLALEQLCNPSAIVLRNDVASRRLEGLTEAVNVISGNVPPLVPLQENGCTYLADLIKGQKTGWFYDQRDNRRLIAGHSVGKRVVDIYSHSGGFGLIAAKQGAAEVTLVDSSALALDLAQQAAKINDVKIATRQGDAFAQMQAMHEEGLRFEVVLADPPAFVKQKKDMAAGLKGYEKVARLATNLVEPGGLLFVASCSHHAKRAQFNQAVKDGIKKAGRSGKVLAQTGAAPDHPVHPQLGQNEYLKGILLKID